MKLSHMAWITLAAAGLASCGDSTVGPVASSGGSDASRGGSSSGATNPSPISGSAAGSGSTNGSDSDAGTLAANPVGQAPSDAMADSANLSTPSGPADGASATGDMSRAGPDASSPIDANGAADAQAAGDASATSEGGANRDQGGGSSTGALHVSGNVIDDGDGTRVVMRGPELVIRWGVYSGLTSAGVDVPWEGGSNNNVGSPTIREIGKTKANAIRIYGGIGNELDGILNTAIVEQKMFVGVGRVDWANAQMKATLDKYGNYVFIHPRGEFTYRDANQWRTDSLTVVKYIRGLGYKQAIEIGTTGYGQTWSTIQMYGQEVAASDPLKNTFFLLQLYSELAQAIPQTLTAIAAFPYPVTVDACLFTSTYGNTPDTYKQVWDQSFAKNFSSFYWDWWGDGTGASMTTGGTFASLDAIGQYIVNNSPAALKNTVKTPFLSNATVP